jgi:hypothetical protein
VMHCAAAGGGSSGYDAQDRARHLDGCNAPSSSREAEKACPCKGRAQRAERLSHEADQRVEAPRLSLYSHPVLRPGGPLREWRMCHPR